MNFQQFSSFTLSFVLVIFLLACEKESFTPEATSIDNNTSVDLRGNNGKGNGKKDKTTEEPATEEPVDEEPATFTGTTFRTVDFDPNNLLYQFIINEAGDLILFETKPANEEIGTDFFGTWADPFTFENNQVVSLGGLRDFTWDFTLQPDGVSYRVVETEVARNEFDSSDVTVTVTDLGIYTQI